MDTHQSKRHTALEREESVIRPAAFQKNAVTDELWDEKKAEEISRKYKENFVEQVTADAMQAMLRVFAAAGLLANIDKDNVDQFLMTNESVKAFGCAGMGIDHPFHAVAKKVIMEPDDKTRSLVGYMIMTAEGTLSSTTRESVIGEETQGK